MKILAVSHLYPNADEPRYGIFVARQLAAMAAEDARIELIVPRLYTMPWLKRLLRREPGASHRAKLLEFPGISARSVPFFAFPGKSFKRRAGAVMHKATLATARALHHDVGFDVVYGTDWFLGADVARRLGTSLGLTSAGLAIGSDINITAQQSPANHRRFVEIANGLHATLACGDSLAQAIDSERHGGTTLSVYGVVDLEQFQPTSDKPALREQLKLPTSGKILLYAGYLWKRKGLIELIEAFEHLCRDFNTSLVLCGQGEDESEIRKRANESAACSHIHFIGALRPEQMPGYMQAADVFVLPSYAEGIPNAVMEAMACGLPVVCTAVGGLPQAVGNSGAARLVPPRNPQALEAAIREVIEDEGRQATMRCTARSLAESRFDVRVNARRILKHLQQAIDRRIP